VKSLSEVVYKGDLVSRFFCTSDTSTDDYVLPLPTPWWSRRYEYPWAGSFLETGYRVLDAACGISHPFKFCIAAACDAYACDLDTRITDEDAIIRDVIADFGSCNNGLPGNDAQEDLRRSIRKLNRTQANITALPYEDKFFNRVFCISVLEHMPREDMLKALKEFRRVLKPDGLIILTFDVPTISTALFANIVQASDLSFAGAFDPQVTKDTVTTNMYGGLSCFRAVLKC
jgi:SAM-dependent methyltransferase